MLIKPRKEIHWKHIDPDICLAKTEAGENCALPGLTVKEHSILTGEVAKELAGRFPYLKNLDLFPDIAFTLAALHDVGKICPPFQKKLIASLPATASEEFSRRLGISACNTADIDHAAVSYAVLRVIYNDTASWIAGMHHGGFSQGYYLPDDEIIGGSEWQSDREKFIKEITALYEGDDSVLQDCPPSLSCFIAGLVSVSDWISSSVSADSYRKHGKALAKWAVDNAGFHFPDIKKGLCFEDIFGFPPRAEQSALSSMAREPGIYILEAEMGSGKTEAALYAAYQMLASGQATGLYFALPTAMASKAIYRRVNRFIDRITNGDSSKVRLIYASSFLSDISYAAGIPDWFDSRKRMLLAPFGVGTIDQALMSVIHVRHSCVRTFGLAGKIVILDEVHSYDQYTSSLIQELVAQLKGLGATVIILSATLRREDKKKLLSKWGKANDGDGYPCLTGGNSIMEERVLPVRKHKHIQLIHEPDTKAALEKAIDYAFEGNRIIWIENSIKDAQDLYRIASARCSGTDVGIGLLHSRYIGKDRQEKEDKYLALFGKRERSCMECGYILFGTQVLEQSLDIDADVMFSRIAPIDMLFQRSGRLWRHDIPGREGDARFHLLCPTADEIAKNEKSFGLSAIVYSSYVLYRTSKVLQYKDHIIIPDDIRSCIEDVYSCKDESIPWVIKSRNEAERKHNALDALALRSTLTIGAVESDTAFTRYSEYATRDILLVRSVRISGDAISALELLSGETVELESKPSARKRVEIASRIESCIVSVPAKSIPASIALDYRLCAKLRNYVYVSIADAERLLIFISENETLRNITGEIIPDASYSRSIGYVLSGLK